MSKIGSRKIEIPEAVNVQIGADFVKTTGPKGELELEIPKNIVVKKEGSAIEVSRLRHGNYTRSLHGLIRKLIYNNIFGVSQGFERKLDFKGVGFKAEVQGNKLILNVGFSHPVEIEAPEKIEFKVEKNIITVSGIDCQKVGQIAAQIRAVKPVEPYKGKGIKYLEEIPRRKPGKAAKAIAGAGAGA
jgi:large subunit ribosomal protein L6